MPVGLAQTERIINVTIRITVSPWNRVTTFIRPVCYVPTKQINFEKWMLLRCSCCLYNTRTQCCAGRLLGYFPVDLFYRPRIMSSTQSMLLKIII